MTDNGRKLKELRDGLEGFIREHSDILEHEGAVRHYLDAAAAEVRRRDRAVNDGPSHPLGLND